MKCPNYGNIVSVKIFKKNLVIDIILMNAMKLNNVWLNVINDFQYSLVASLDPRPCIKANF